MKDGLHPKNIWFKLLLWIFEIQSPSLGRKIKFKDIFDKHCLG